MPRHIGIHEDVAFIRACRDDQEHLLAVGPPGTGKTALADAAFFLDATSEHSGMETLTFTADTTEADLLGTFVQDPDSGAFVWVHGPLTRSVLADVPFYADEPNLSDSRVLSPLYALMDGRGFLRVPANPTLAPIPVGSRWFVIAACNPDVPGGQLSEAFIDRFDHVIEVGTDWALAVDLGVLPELVDAARALDEKRRNGMMSWSPQMRTLLSFQRANNKYGLPYALGNLLRKAPADALPLVQAEFADRGVLAGGAPNALGGRFRGRRG